MNQAGVIFEKNLKAPTAQFPSVLKQLILEILCNGKKKKQIIIKENQIKILEGENHGINIGYREKHMDKRAAAQNNPPCG